MAEKKETKLNLAQKLVEIRKSIDVFVKDTKGHNYSYVSGTQVLGKIRGKMDELGILLIPEMDDEPTTYSKEGNDFVVTSKMTYAWYNADDGKTITIRWKLLGKQNDPSKAFGSGLTYSERYFLLKFFGVPTDDDDPDANQAPKTQAKQFVQPSPVAQAKTTAVVKNIAAPDDELDNEMADKVMYEEGVDFCNAKLKELKQNATEKLVKITERDIQEIGVELQKKRGVDNKNPIYVKVRSNILNPEIIALSRNK